MEQDRKEYRRTTLRSKKNGKDKDCSVDKKDSNKMKKFSFIKDRIIPLEDEDGNLHNDWSTWFKSLSQQRISSNYPLALNDHPSLSAHKLIAKSIIQFLDKKDILFRKDYI